MSEMSARPATPADIPAIERLALEFSSTSCNAAALLETALLCIVAVDEAQNIVGFLCLDDVSIYRLGSMETMDQRQWLVEQGLPNLSTTVYVRVSALNPEHEVHASTVLLKLAFMLLPTITTIHLTATRDIELSEAGLGQYFTLKASNRGLSSFLFTCTKTAVMRPLVISRARVEDHDDMVPVLERASQVYPALAKLPETSRPDEPYALTRVVSGQDDNNVVLVARSNGKIVGFLVVTTEVDIAPLHSLFDLHPYDNFWPVPVYDEHYAASQEHLVTSMAQQWKEDFLADALKTYEVEANEAHEAGKEFTRAEPTMEQAEIAFQLKGSEKHLTISDDDVKQLMMKSCDEITAKTASTIFAITMMCIDEDFQAQAVELLQAAFAAFPAQDYCVVTLPHEAREPSVISNMTRVPPLPGALFPEVLYVFHRSGMLQDFTVRLAVPGDMEGIAALTEGMLNSAELRDLFASAQAGGMAIVACIQEEVVGMCTLNPQVDMTLLMANFNLGSLLDLQHHTSDSNAEIDIYIMNPIFAHRHRSFLAGVQRLLKKTTLYYAVPPGQQPPDMLDVLLQVPPRHRTTPPELSANFALYVFNRRQAFDCRRSINTQVIVVGASECGLAAIERLLLDHRMSFNNITLLAPGGLSTSAVACQYTSAIIDRIGLETRVTLVDAEMVGLDRERQSVQLSDGSFLSYGLLLITAGLQDQTRTRIFEADANATAAVVSPTELAADFAYGDAEVVGPVLVYGDTLAAYHALQILESRGAAKKMRFLAAPGQVDPVASMLREVAAGLLTFMPAPEPLSLEELNSIPGSMKVTAILKGEEVVEETEIGLLVSCCPPDVSGELFKCLNEASIVYDGRVVVDATFKTNDPNIYAAGTIAKLSRRYGHNVHFEHYNSKDVGTRLAESAIASIHGHQDPSVVPSLHAAKVVGCNAPGNMTFMFVGGPSAMTSPSVQPPEGGEKLSTISDAAYFQMNLDRAKRVHSIIYLGKQPLQASKLSALVGLHVDYLNNLHERISSVNMDNFVTFLAQPWADVLYHDEWPMLRRKMLLDALRAVEDGVSPADLSLQVQETTLEFVRAHIGELPNYKLLEVQ